MVTRITDADRKRNAAIVAEAVRAELDANLDHSDSHNEADMAADVVESLIRRYHLTGFGRDDTLVVRGTFTTPYDQHASREGQLFTLVRSITEPDSDHDAEVLPVHVIRFDDGTEIEAWPEEIVL